MSGRNFIVSFNAFSIAFVLLACVSVSAVGQEGTPEPLNEPQFFWKVSGNKVIPLKTFDSQQDEPQLTPTEEVEPALPTPAPEKAPYEFDEDSDSETDEDSADTEGNDDLDSDKVTSAVENSIEAWPNKSIRDINIDIRDFNPTVPRDRSYQLIQSSGSDWNSFQPGQKVFAWAAPNIRYQPLYFEDIALERYGQARGDVRQFAASSVHFFKSAVLLPYSMTIDHPKSCDYPLGFCRPGNVVPRTTQKHWFGSPFGR